MLLIEGEKLKNGTSSTERLLSSCSLLKLPGQCPGNNCINFPSKIFDYLKLTFSKRKHHQQKIQPTAHVSSNGDL